MMRAISLWALLALAPIAASAQADRTFGDWSLACDNVRMCTAIGYSAENASNAYMTLTRTAGPSGTPVVVFAVTSDGPARPRKLVVMLHRRGEVDIVLGPLDALSDGYVARARVAPGMGAVVAVSLREASTITVRLVDKANRDESGDVLLHGSTAALLAMDDHQGRLGTSTALVGFGRGPASTVPREDALPAVFPKRITHIGTPGHPGINPAGHTDAVCENAGELWFRLANGRQIRGVCINGGAYNTAYRFYDAATKPLRVVPFRIPWKHTGTDDDVLVNPSLSADGMMLSSFFKDVGLGTCGEAADWIWDGSAFRLFRFREMRECRGVSSVDWPALYRAWMR